MKKHLFVLLAAAAVAFPSYAQQEEEETRTIRLIQDDAQDHMATQVYNLKNLKASDIAMYVDAAVRRYNKNSLVRSLNFRVAKQQSVIVTAPVELLPYIDQIVETLDRGTKRDEYDSVIVNAGYTWQVYYPKYRWGKDLVNASDMMLSNNGATYYANNALWIKDDAGDVEYALDWVKYFDRPVPQAKLTFRYYTVRESTLRDIGLDYLAWKNGPGMNLGDFAYSSGRIAWDKVFNTAANVGSGMCWSYGGAFTAPAFDMSFVRILQQSGDAKVLAEATITVINDQNFESVASLSPNFNALVKDPDTHESSVIAMNNTVPDFAITLSANPSICFFAQSSDINDMGWIPADKAFYDRNQGSIVFGYSISSNEIVEANNYGATVSQTFSSNQDWKTVEMGREQVLVNGVREYDIEQTTGVPFLCELPVLKYIFGTTTTSKEKDYVIVTVQADLVFPDTVAAK